MDDWVDFIFVLQSHTHYPIKNKMTLQMCSGTFTVLYQSAVEFNGEKWCQQSDWTASAKL